jgi:hypothetical protein
MAFGIDLLLAQTPESPSSLSEAGINMLWNKSMLPGVGALGVLLMLLAGCQAPKTQPGASASRAETPPVVGSAAASESWALPRPGASLYEIDATRSLLRLLVYRGGAMAAMGHDHVIQNRALAGWVDAASSDAEASFYLAIPVADFTIDEPAARAEEGPNFAEEVSAEAKSGTRHNLLSAALLDGAAYRNIAIRGSDIRVQGIGAQVPATSYQATVQIAIAGHVSTRTISFDLSRSGDLLTATAEFPLRQSALGLTPFSVMMGALRVEDEIRVKLTLVAVRRR